MATVAPFASANNITTSDLDNPMVMVFRISKRANELQFDLQTYASMSDICDEEKVNLAKLDDSITIKRGAYDINLAVILKRSSESLSNLAGQYPIHLFIATNSAWIQQVPENLRVSGAQIKDGLRVNLNIE
ncbi:hypothetical protein B9Z65_3700 [Elsinoe australis]|uniref:Uncharacterized protein n=1 Tax=Elsinoe australis TaxID=40998 RepID=A0A2P8AFZ4_9PEZI|nr:hypothetical protein B9Z65_3700 [Elsinoe australis]